ncbi:hypothetical protein [Candidatus Methylopumilus turicensis]|uniref:DUF481 domain-containing protein n=1 Tax=Candidatus Methylopumilus turicensis TaxID=1581680 RepID=A0A0B7ITV2_9PROT|nr:hypothetical protein [Candidatus Methylopumilus turicensis]CEN55715.1 conserved exported protein of unknown function [Candidatus Methylopumilus turicensis]
MHARLFLALLLSITFSAQAAALMGFKDSAMLMSEFSNDRKELMLNYSPALGHAFGVETMWMRGDKQTNLITNINYAGLIKRWNMPNGQANLWFMTGIGEASGDSSGFSYSPSVQFDYETTRIYFLAKARIVRAPHIQYDTYSVQSGFSLYETSFEETQPWLVIEAKTSENMMTKNEVTPALRLINQNYFLELGITNPWDAASRTPRLNLMLTF